MRSNLPFTLLIPSPLKKSRRFLIGVLAGGACLALASCATKTDPVAKLLKDNGNYAMVQPPSTGLNLGDFHHDRKLQQLDIPISKVLSPSQIQTLMSNPRQAALPSTTGSKSYEISVSAAYVGVASGDFKNTGATKFTVTPGTTWLYDAPLTSGLAYDVIPAIQRKYPGVDLSGGYIIRSLMKADSLSYKFTNSSGTAVNLAADKNLVAKLTNLGFKVSNASEKTNELTFSQPMFIGYRLAKVQRNGSVVGASALPTGKVSYALKDISPAAYPAIDLKASTKPARHAR